MNDIMDKDSKFKERKIEFYSLLFVSFTYPIFIPFAILYTLWRWGFDFFINPLKMATFLITICGAIIAYFVIKATSIRVKDYKPGNKFLTIGGIELEILRKIVIKTLENNRKGYEITLNKKPEHSFSEVLYRKSIFTVKLEKGSSVKIKKDRYFKKEDELSRKVWDLQYVKTKSGKREKEDAEILRELSKRLEDYIVD